MTLHTMIQPSIEYMVHIVMETGVTIQNQTSHVVGDPEVVELSRHPPFLSLFHFLSLLHLLCLHKRYFFSIMAPLNFIDNCNDPIQSTIIKSFVDNPSMYLSLQLVTLVNLVVR